jgi:hypothetical protein
VGILAADPDAQCEPARCELRECRELARDWNWMTQRQQVKRDIHRQVGLRSE